MKTQAVNNKNNKPAEFLIKGLWWDNSVKWGALTASQAAPVTTPHQLRHHRRRERGRSWQGQWEAAGFLLWCLTPAFSLKKKVGRKEQCCAMPHMGIDWTMLMMVQSQQLDSWSWLNTSAFRCEFICVCVVCVHVCVPSLMQNGRGIPNHSVCHPVLTFS